MSATWRSRFVPAFVASRPWPWAALLFLAIGLLLRAPHFGNPVVGIDEQFYLLAGDRMLSGDLPFVDHWDRKPVGLFLLYAAACLFGGDGVFGHQLLALICVVATAVLIARTASRIAPLFGAIVAGALYIVWLNIFGGHGGQAPVFYNLPMAAAGALVMTAVTRPAFDRRAFLLGCLATFIVGLTLQIKYTAVFEGLFFGLALIWAARRSGLRWPSILRYAAIWALLGILPTLIAWGVYAGLGHGDAFFYANFQAVFERPLPDGKQTLKRLIHIFGLTSPLILCALAAWLSRARSVSRAYGFAAAWALAVMAGFLAFGTYFHHYAMPLLAPLLIVSAPAIANRRFGIGIVARTRSYWLPFFILVPLFGLVAQALIVKKLTRRQASEQEVAAMVEQLRMRMTPGECIFVFHGEPVLYHLTQACTPTAWTFTGHLSHAGDATGIGTDPLVETRRIMAGKPHLVVSTQDRPKYVNFTTWAFMENELKLFYRPVFSTPIGNCCTRVIYERKPGS